MDYVEIAIIASAVATIIIAFCAIMGLDTWKKRHESDLATWKKQQEFDLVIRHLASIYKYRDAVVELINLSDDDPTPDSSENKSNLTEKDFRGRIELLREYVRKTKSVRQEFYADILKSEALWGEEELRLMVGEMPTLETIARNIVTSKLILRTPEIIDHFGHGAKERERIEQDIKNLESDGPIEKRFDDLIKKAENYLNKKMQSHR